MPEFYFKVTYYTKGYTVYETTSQYGNILSNCLYQSSWLSIIIAPWSKALVLWTTDPEFKSTRIFC